MLTWAFSTHEGRVSIADIMRDKVPIYTPWLLWATQIGSHIGFLQQNIMLYLLSH